MKLSIITINYNNKAGLEKTVASVMAQTWRDFEWIIIDGGSTDGSAEVIAELAKNPDANISYWCSEPDKGIYNAMNKGIAHAHGEYLQFLNSGDCLVDERVIGDFCKLKRDEDIISGEIIVDGSYENARHTAGEWELDYEYMAKLTILHPSSFIKRELFEKYGGYDERYKIVSDWKFFLEVLIKYNCSYRRWWRYIVDFNTGGISESPEMRRILCEERKEVLENFMPRVQRTVDKKNAEITSLDLPVLTIFKNKLRNKLQNIVRDNLERLCRWYIAKKGYHYKKKDYQEKVIVSMTSWKKRIDNVPAVIDSLMRNTMKPNFIVLNLSLVEFPNKEKDLPKELLQYVDVGILEIEWQEGNTKAFKKFIPTLHKYPKDVIIAIDDDFLYPKDFIETFVVAHEKTPWCPLSGNLEVVDDVQAHCGCGSLVKAEYFGKYLDEFIDDEIIAMGMDDVFYTVCAEMNNCHYKYVGKMFFVNMPPNNPVEGLSENSKHSNLEMFDYLYKKGVEKYKISWGILSKPVFKI